MSLFILYSICATYLTLSVDLPGFGLVLAVIVMGAFLMFQIIRKKESD